MLSRRKALITGLLALTGILGQPVVAQDTIDMQGKTLILGLASDVLVSKIDKPDQIEAIQKLIKDEFGADVSVRCVVTNAKGKIPANVAQDGMVATAIQHGGEIVDTQD